MSDDQAQFVVPIGIPPQFDTAPPGWKWKKLSAIAQLESGHTPSRSRTEWWGGDVSWVSLTEIRALDGKWVEATQIKTNEAGIANSSARLLPRGTVCFSRTASVGFVTILARPMATSQDFANWICGDELDPEFLMYALIAARPKLRAMATGATHKTIYMPELQSFYICAPERDEQIALVAEIKRNLDCIHEARRAVECQLRDLTQLKAKALDSLFKTIGNSLPIGAVAKVQSGYAFKSETFKTNGVRLLRNTNILPGRVYWDTAAYIDASAVNGHSSYSLCNGDVLISLDRPLISSGIKVARVFEDDLPSLLVQRVGRFLIDETQLDAEYLYAFLQTSSFIAAISGHDQSLGVPHISPSQIEAIKIPIVGLSSQKLLVPDMACIISEWNAAFQAVKAELIEFRQLYKKVLAKAFNPR